MTWCLHGVLVSGTVLLFFSIIFPWILFFPVDAGIIIRIEENLPLQDYFDVINNHFEVVTSLYSSLWKWKETYHVHRKRKKKAHLFSHFFIPLLSIDSINHCGEISFLGAESGSVTNCAKTIAGSLQRQESFLVGITREAFLSHLLAIDANRFGNSTVGTKFVQGCEQVFFDSLVVWFNLLCSIWCSWSVWLLLLFPPFPPFFFSSPL